MLNEDKYTKKYLNILEGKDVNARKKESLDAIKKYAKLLKIKDAEFENLSVKPEKDLLDMAKKMSGLYKFIQRKNLFL